MTVLKTVTFKGSRLSRNQQEFIQLNKKLWAMRKPDFLRSQVDEALARQRTEVVEPYKEWTFIHMSKGTPFLGDCFVR